MLNNCTSSEKVNSTGKSSGRKINNRIQSQRGVYAPAPRQSCDLFRMMLALDYFLSKIWSIILRQSKILTVHPSQFHLCLTCSGFCGRKDRLRFGCFLGATHPLPGSNFIPSPHFLWLCSTWTISMSWMQDTVLRDCAVPDRMATLNQVPPFLLFDDTDLSYFLTFFWPPLPSLLL